MTISKYKIILFPHSLTNFGVINFFIFAMMKKNSVKWFSFSFIFLWAKLSIIYLFIHSFIVFLGLHLWHMEALRLVVKLELQLPAYTTATATRDQNWVCKLHHSSQQYWMSYALSKAKDWPCILMDTNWIHFHYTTMGTPKKLFRRYIMVVVGTYSFSDWPDLCIRILHQISIWTASIRNPVIHGPLLLIY